MKEKLISREAEEVIFYRREKESMYLAELGSYYRFDRDDPLFFEFIAYLGFNTPLLAAQEKKYYELADGEADPKESQCIVVDVSFRFCSEIPKISDYGGGRFTTKEYMPRDKQAI